MTFTCDNIRAFLQQGPEALAPRHEEIIYRCIEQSARMKMQSLSLDWLEELDLLGEHFAAFVEFLDNECSWGQCNL